MAGVATFPLLRTGELVASLVDIGVPNISADDVDRPKAAKVVPVYAWFLTALTQLTLEDVMVAAQFTLDSLSANPDLPTELLRETVYQGALYAVLDQLMHWACLDDFSVKDIRDPQPARLRRILSALVNFYLFEQDQMPRLVHLEEASEGLAREEHELERRMVELQDAIEKKRAAMAVAADQAAEIEQTNTATRTQLLEKRSQASSLSTGIEAAKYTRGQLQAKVEDLSQSLSALDLEITRLRSRIVQSPNRVKAAISDLSHSVQAMKEDIASHELRTRDYSARIKTLRAYEGQIHGTLSALDDWETELRHAQTEESKQLRLAEMQVTQSELLKNRELKVAQAQRRINTVADQKDRHERQAEAKREALSAKLQDLQSQHEHLMARRQDTDEEAARRHKAIALKEKEILDLVKGVEAQIAESETAYRELRRQVEAYSARLNTSLDELNAYNSV